MAKKEYQIVWTLKSKEDLLVIYEYLCLVHDKEKAFDFIKNMIDKVGLLKRMPLLGQKEVLLTKIKRKYRRLIEGNYKIVYNFRNEIVYVNRIFDSRQDPSTLKVK